MSSAIVILLTAANAVILGVVAYLFYAFRGAVDSSGVKQIDDYLHELEGSVAQLTEQFERTSTKISKDLLRKTTELQALIGEADTKLAQMARGRALAAAEPAPARRFEAELAEESPISERPYPVAAGEGRVRVPAEQPPTPAPVQAQSPAPAQQPAGMVPAAVAARRMSASELLSTRPAAAARPAQPAASAAAPANPQPAQRSEPVAPEPQPQPQPPADFTPGLPAQVDARTVAAAAAANQPNDKYRLIFLLASEGMDAASIAKHTNLTRGEVEMLLDLRRQEDLEVRHMIKGLYTAASSMLAGMRKQEVISNNLANANTIGFRGDDAEQKAFPLLFLQRLFDTNRDSNGDVLPSNLVGGVNTGLMIDQVTTSFREGSIRQTQSPLDMAIRDTAGPNSPPAFFAVQTPNGTEFTRDGSFSLNANGELVTNQGYRVLGANGAPITFPAEAVTPGADVKVSPGGAITYNNNAVGQLQIVTFANPVALDKPGNTLFAQNVRSGPPTPAQAADYVIQNQALELSNVDPMRSMAEMMDTLRAYEMNQKMVQTQDQVLGMAVNDIAKL